MSLIKDYIFHTVVSNFKTDVDRLKFEDFVIIKLKQGKEAAGWRKKLGSKKIPRFILEKEFKNYKIEDNDITYCDNVIEYIWKLLFIFRLYKPGDLLFLDDLIHDINKDEDFTNVYIKDTQSDMKYSFYQNEIGDFESFRKKIFNTNIFNNNFFKIFINYFMSGVNRGINFSSFFRLERIIDYFIALESVFLIDGSSYFISHLISERISRLLSNDEKFDKTKVKKLIKFIYNLRSKIVHGNFIDIREEDKNKKLNDIKTEIMEFEKVIREAFKDIVNYNFSSKIELEKFLKQIYAIPKDSKKIMIDATTKARKLF